MKTMKETYGNEFFNKFTNLTNRSANQTEFLYELCNYYLDTLVELEEKLANNFVGYCPGDKETVEMVLLMENNKKVLDMKFKISDSKNGGLSIIGTAAAR